MMGEKRFPALRCLTFLWWCVAFLWWCVAAVIASEHKHDFPKEFDLRYTSYHDMRTNSSIYSHANITDYTKLLIDSELNQLVVGSRNTLFRLDLDTLIPLQEVNVEPDNNNNAICNLKTRDNGKCNNFIRVLQYSNYTKTDGSIVRALFVCGTNAFNPECTWRLPNDLSFVLSKEPGLGITPYDPSHNSTAIITSNRDIYGATNLGPDDRDPAIYRKIGTDTKSNELRTAQSNSLWLNEPEFISSYEMKDAVYFFFREVAVEFINCGKRVYSRVARVCKEDQGGMDKEWTTFFKSRLNCSLPGEFPFYFDEIQSSFLLQDRDQTFIYAIFTTPTNSIAGSAVCVFNLTAFETSFNGPFKHQENPRSAWERHEQNMEKGPTTQCPERKDQTKRSNEHFKSSMMEKKYQLMDSAVQPVTHEPLVHDITERWTHVVVDNVQAKTSDNQIVEVKVLFIATETGRLKKMARLPGSKEACLIEELKILPNGEHKPVKDIKLASDKMSLFITTQQTILKIPVHRCAKYTNSELCVNARDPYCGWNTDTDQCVTAPARQPEVHYWRQLISGCPIVKRPVNGMWSSWSSWDTCSQVGGDPTLGACLCRSRSCNDPKPINGGEECPGAGVEVTNCTAHGQWTDWTAWSSCSQTCGSTAIRHRHRYCSNPPPRFGGRDCLGHSSEEDYCQGHPPCPVPPVRGNWTLWSSWSDCSANCNGGMQTRKRACVYSPPSDNPIPCDGNIQEWRLCNTQTCEVHKKSTPWTPWVITNRTRGGHFAERYRFVCEANVSNSDHIRIKASKPDVQFCIDGHECQNSEDVVLLHVDGGWSLWSSWTACSRDCGSGERWRQRECSDPRPLGLGQDCVGHAREGKECNSHSCQGEWGCWSAFSVCSVTCGRGIVARSRWCDTVPLGHKYNVPCVGDSEEFSNCDMGPCTVAIESSRSGTMSYLERVQFSLAQMLLVGALAFLLGGLASFALYAYVTSFCRAMKHAREQERLKKEYQKQRELRTCNNRKSVASMKSLRHDPSMTSQTSMEHMFTGRYKVYDVDGVTKETMFEPQKPFYSTLDKNCTLQGFTIKDL